MATVVEPSVSRIAVESSPASLAEQLSGGQWRAYAHHELLAAKLVDVAAGRCKRLIVTMPPRHGKSELVSYWGVVWLLNLRPSSRVILASYAATLANGWGRRVRNTLRDHRDQLRVRLAVDSRAANYWHTTAGGYMATVGVGGGITGKGADLLVIDDPFKDYREANSPVTRQAVWDWYTSTARTRLQQGGAIIVVHTRWHRDDLIGRLLAQDDEGTGEGWEVINLPAVAESETDALGRARGEVLWPEVYDADALGRVKLAVGPYVWDALYQQRPTAPGGVVFLREWFEGRDRRFAWPPVETEHTDHVVARYQSWDTAIKDGEEDAWTVGITLDLLSDYRVRVVNVVRTRVLFPLLPGTIEAVAEASNTDGKLREIVVEDKASGTPAIDTLRATAPQWLRERLVAFQPSGDKEQRAKQAAVWCANGSVLLPHPGAAVPWLHDFEGELFEFPRAQFADQVDAFAQGVLYLEHYLAAGLDARITAGRADPYV